MNCKDFYWSYAGGLLEDDIASDNWIVDLASIWHAVEDGRPLGRMQSMSRVSGTQKA